ncbi:T6SS phospholipase effector Tle1-like catalytic domain-containing protein [Reinekea sp.]|uniref:T6SS phospholipase effector Tle1-like catalytic domain-containing protein n=1 Tax=Reinekea sp. TaxID=1970455 RepID=UPI00398A0C9A
MDLDLSSGLLKGIDTAGLLLEHEFPILEPLSFLAFRQLPQEIQKHYKEKSLPLCKVEKHQVERFRNNPLTGFWVKSGRTWGIEPYYASRFASEVLILIPQYATQRPELNEDCLDVATATCVSNQQPQELTEYWNGPLSRSTHPQPDRLIHRQPLISIYNKGESVLKKGGHNVKANIADYVWQQGDTPTSVAQTTRGHQDARGLFEFDKHYSEKSLPQAGDVVRLHNGWLISLSGCAQYTKSINLKWQGPVTGQQSFSFDDAKREDFHEWSIEVELPPGEYTITAQSGEATVTEQINVISVKTLQFGLFFDGTGKNYNADKHCETDEFEPSNIAKLYECYKQDVSRGIGRHYIDGIGTVDIENEVQICQNVEPGWKEKLAQAFGVGMKARIEEAYRRVLQFLGEVGENQKHDLIIDLFGYSRGAANARAFINDFHELIKKGELPDKLQKLEDIKFRFLGLYETVGSIGIPGDEFNCPYNLNLNFGSANAVYHLCALHEQRAYFPLSSVKSEPGKVTPHTFKEEYMPGAHADVGGGQALANHPKTITLSRFVVSYLKDNKKSKQRAERKAAERIEEIKLTYAPWGGDLKVKRKEKLNEHGNAFNIHIAITLVRAIDPQLEHLSLLKMYQQAKKHYLPLQELSILDLHRLRYQVPGNVNANVARAMKGDEVSMDWLKANYIEISHQPDAPAGDVLHVDKPEKRPENTTPLGIRELFYNYKEKAV